MKKAKLYLLAILTCSVLHSCHQQANNADSTSSDTTTVIDEENYYDRTARLLESPIKEERRPSDTLEYYAKIAADALAERDFGNSGKDKKHCSGFTGEVSDISNENLLYHIWTSSKDECWAVLLITTVDRRDSIKQTFIKVQQMFYDQSIDKNDEAKSLDYMEAQIIATYPYVEMIERSCNKFDCYSFASMYARSQEAIRIN